MNLSKNWLSDFVDIEISPKDFADGMTMSGSKVETYMAYADQIKNVVVGKILEIKEHPNAQKLVICIVDVGKEKPLQIVTGASNVNKGDLVPVALDGSTLYGGVQIKKGKLRGEVSEGMLCSLGELGLNTHVFPNAIEDGIFIIDFDCKIGQNILDAIGLNDEVFEFEITPNRPDCLSVIGLAREVSATFKKPFKKQNLSFTSSDDGDKAENYLKVEIKNKDLCKRYSARIIKDIKIEPSPMWLRNRLFSCGIRPINNIVDITNYVMLEYGQPMHAFDYKCLGGKEIVVRNASDNESFTTLDGQQRTLSSDMLVIADAEKSVAVAGVMGGANSEITESTKTVVFESASFNGASVRRTSKKLGLRTDSSSRFEKGLDPQNTIPALDRACQLVEQLRAGTVVDGLIDQNFDDRQKRVIKLDAGWINKFLGTEIPEQYMIDALKRLDFKVDNDKNITVPSFRDDVMEKADIAEEIVRLYGYNDIPTTLVNMQTTEGMLTDIQRFTKKINELLIAQGASEICTYSFVSPKMWDKLNFSADDKRRDCVVISNPLGEDTSVMRTTSIGSMLTTLAYNYNNGNDDVCMYELANTYLKNADINKLPDEKTEISIGCYGKSYDFYGLKGMVEGILDGLNIKDIRFIPLTDDPTFHPGKTAEIYQDNVRLGVVGEIHPNVCENFGISEKVYAAALSVECLYNAKKDIKQYSSLPKFPATTRDLALLCPKDITVYEIEKVIKEKSKGILESVGLFDVYEGAQIPSGMISLAFSLKYRAKDKTLSDSDIDAKINKIIDALNELGVKIRS